MQKREDGSMRAEADSEEGLGVAGWVDWCEPKKRMKAREETREEG